MNTWEIIMVTIAEVLCYYIGYWRGNVCGKLLQEVDGLKEKLSILEHHIQMMEELSDKIKTMKKVFDDVETKKNEVHTVPLPDDYVSFDNINILKSDGTIEAFSCPIKPKEDGN